MIAVFRRIEAQHYRCLKSIRQDLNPFEILVGANASGKSTFLDVVAFLSDFVTHGLEVAVERRTVNFHDLVWGRESTTFTLAVQALIPSDKRTMRPMDRALKVFPNASVPRESDVIDYRVVFKLDPSAEKLYVDHESAVLGVSHDSIHSLPIIVRRGTTLNFTSEAAGESYQRDQHRNYSSLTGIPADSSFPASAWLRGLLREGIKTVALDARDLAKASPPALGETQQITGLGLARSVAQLKADRPQRFQDWISHVRTALPDISVIDSVPRDEDKHRYLMIQYENRVRVPAWMLSEGTLRLLALTILAYLPEFFGVYLVEEPENGVHPTALEAIYQSLSSVYDAQVLVASHSPILLNMASPDQILVFSKTAEGAKIVRGSDHPALQDWRKEVSLGTLAASGILG
jgi:predicted ATPase